MSEKTEELKDLLKVKGINAKGYGIIPKTVMQDERLTIESKAIYSYFCSFAGVGTTAFPSISKMCKDLKISEDRLRKHIKALIELNYISIEREKGPAGRFGRNIYTLNTNPDTEKVLTEKKSPSPQNKGMDKPIPLNHQGGKLPSSQNNSTNNNKGFKSNSSYKNNNSNFEPNKFIPQCQNFEQREYDDNYYDQFITNKN